MAKGTTIGFLNFGIDGDNKELLKKLEQVKKEAVSIEQILKNIKLNTGGKTISTDIQKAQKAADGLVISSNKAAESQNKVVASFAKSRQEIEKVNTEQQRGIKITEEAAATKRASLANEIILSKKASEIEADTNRKNILNQQKLQTELYKTEAAKKRASLIGVQGQKDLAASYGLTNKTMFSQKNILQQLSSAAGIYFSVYQVGAFVKELATVSGEFEKQRVSLAAIIGNADAANKIFNQLKDLAVISPFNFKELTDYAKQLSAFSIPTNEIYDTTKRLADLSAGLGVDMSRIILAYGQVRSAAVLRGQELRQFTEAGIPLVDELAKKFSELEGRVVSAGEVFDKISNREASFGMVKEIITELTSEGGKFFEMQELQSATLAGKISNLRDNYDMMLDSLGRSNKGLLHGAMDGLVDVMDNWEKYWSVLKGIIATYGVYKAALIATMTVDKARNSLAVYDIASKTISIGLTRQHTIETIKQTFAQTALNKAIMANPYILLTSAIIGLGVALWALSDATTTQEKAQERLNEILKQSENIKEELSNKSTQLLGIINSETKSILDQIVAYKDLQAIHGKYLEEIDLQAFKSMSASEQQRILNKSINDFDADNAVNELKRQQKEVDILRSKVEIFSGGTSYSASMGSSAGVSYKKQLEEAEAILDLLEKQARKSDELRKEAEIRSLSEEEQVKWLKEQLELLYDKKKAIDNVAAKAEGLPPIFEKAAVNIKNATFEILGLNSQIDKLTSWLNALTEQNEMPDLSLKTENDINERINSLKKERSDLDITSKAYADYTKRIETLEQRLKKKTTGSKANKDPLIASLQTQLDLIKAAQTEYEKLTKIASSDEALKKLTSIAPFKDLTQADLSQDSLMSLVNSQIEKLSTEKMTDDRQKYLISLFSLQTDTASKIAKENTDKIDKELSKYKDQYSLYEYIFGKTGDKGQAMKIAFGDIEGQVKSYRDALVSAIEKTADTDQQKKLQEQLVDFDFSNKSDFAKRMTDLVSEFQTIDEQITTIKAKGEATRLEIEKNADNASHDIVEKRIKANQDSVNKQVSNLTSGVLQATGSYQRLFGDIADISQKELQYLIDKWKKALSEATKNADGSMTISIDGSQFQTTEKEVASFTKRILKSESELRSRNPFKALKDSLNELKNNRSDIDSIKSQIESLNGSIKLAENSKASGSTDPLNDLIISSSKSKITNLEANLKDLGAKGATSVQKVGTAFAAIGSEISYISQSLSGMFDSLGNEDLADTIGLVGELAGAASDIGQGLASKNPVQVIQGITKGISSIANFHDKKLDKAIRKSQLEVKRLQYAYAEIERTIKRQLGALTEQQSKELIDNQKKQIEELSKQIAAEEKKKKTDRGAVLDMQNQLDEAKDQLKNFYEDLADEQYGINIKDWAGQISDALVNAFASGENAAESFDRSVADIMKNVIKNMIQLSVIEPAMQKLRDRLFGDNGLLANGTTNLSNDTAVAIVGELTNLKDSIDKSKGIWDYLNEAAEKAGISLEETAEKNTLSKGIQSLSEDTGNLLASYLNAMRADLSSQRQFIQQLVMFAKTNTDQFANMYAELVRIQINTLATATNTKDIADTVRETNSILKSVTTKGTGVAINT